MNSDYKLLITSYFLISKAWESIVWVILGKKTLFPGRFYIVIIINQKIDRFGRWLGSLQAIF